MHDLRVQPRRLCVVLAVATAAWSLAILLTGGIALPLISSRNPKNPAIASALLLIAAWVLSEPGRRGLQVGGDLRWLAGALRAAAVRSWQAWGRLVAWIEARVPAATPALLTLIIAAGIIGTALRHTAFVASGSDAWGYVSQAHMWATGTLRAPEPLMAELSGYLPREALAPLAYRPSP